MKKSEKISLRSTSIKVLSSEGCFPVRLSWKAVWNFCHFPQFCLNTVIKLLFMKKKKLHEIQKNLIVTNISCHELKMKDQLQKLHAANPFITEQSWNKVAANKTWFYSCSSPSWLYKEEPLSVNNTISLMDFPACSSPHPLNSLSLLLVRKNFLCI
jgi:hypothetical protein